MVTYEIHCYSGIILPTNNLVLQEDNTMSILLIVMGNAHKNMYTYEIIMMG